MGNVCACGKSCPESAGQHQQRRSGSCSAKSVAPLYRDEIEKALAEARIELDSCLEKNFANDYVTGKIIGHGAFAKVQLCTEVKTQQRFAVKTVHKNPEDLKQREGKLLVSVPAGSSRAQLQEQHSPALGLQCS